MQLDPNYILLSLLPQRRKLEFIVFHEAVRLLHVVELQVGKARFDTLIGDF